MSRRLRASALAIVVAAVGAALLSVAVAPAASPRGHRAVPAVPRFAPLDTVANPKPPGTGTTTDRYSLVHGCFAIHEGQTALGAGDAPYRMQATALGQYLIYGVHSDFLGPGGAASSQPGADTVWQVNGTSARGYELQNLGTGETHAVSFTPAAGCAVYPEGNVDAVGPAFTGASPESTVTGTIDAHTHVTAFEFLGGDFHCGRPWDPFGIQFALPDCAPDETGTNGQVESFLDYGAPAYPHDTRGWPTFAAWPSPTDLAEEGDYYTGIERAWKAGLRVMVSQLVDNEALCTLMTKRHNPCNDMQSVVIQARDLHNLQNYIDAQFGGPGKGFLQIVTNPFQARQVVNAGKLAVVEGIEVSDLFNCGEYLGQPLCSQGQVDAGLRQVRALGVSTFFPIHKFDNAFGGTKTDSGEVGMLVNGGNHLETGHFWNIQTCTGPEHDSTQLLTAPTGGLLTLLDGSVGQSLLPGLPTLPGVPGLPALAAPPPASQLPVYPPPPHCNTRGLTDLGAYLINKMIQEHFIVELDHMDAKTADATLAILEAHHYSGVISAHSWDSPEQNPRIYNLGGFVTPIAGASPGAFVAQWQASRKIRNPRFYDGTGFGYGADMNGLAEESQPDTSNPITYPFHSFDGQVTFTREVWGQRTFDLNRDGVANYGMFPDWLQELSLIGGRPLMTDMFHGAEAYLQMWERAYGVPAGACRPAGGRLGAAGLGALRLNLGTTALLYAAGQPAGRPGRAFSYCVTGSRGADYAVFSPRGQVRMVATSARGLRAGTLRVGGRARAAHGLRRVAGGLWLGRRLAHGDRIVYRVRGGRVLWAAAVTAFDARSAARMRSDARAAGLR